MNVIRRGTLNYVIPELKNESNPIFVPNLRVNGNKEYPVPDQRSIRSMYYYDMFIYITQDNGIDGESWISVLLYHIITIQMHMQVKPLIIHIKKNLYNPPMKLQLIMLQLQKD